MNILVTAGNTQAPLDRVRCITNIFSGRTGARVAVEGFERGHAITLLTSHPEVLGTIPEIRTRAAPDWTVRYYRTFDDLEALMAEEFAYRYDAVIHAAAVSDYLVGGVFTHHDGRFESVAAGKVKSTYPELWVKLSPAPKLVDRIRAEWGFSGTLVKFKLEVGVSEPELVEIAERSRVHSRADLICANTLESLHECALIGAGPDGYRRVSRDELATRLIDAIEAFTGTGADRQQ